MIQDTRRGSATIEEIRTQADSWTGTLQRIDGATGRLKILFKDAREILFAGCGSAFNVSHAVAPYFQKISGKICKAVHSSDILLNPEMFIRPDENTIVVVYSRSGSTTESAMAVRKARALGCKTLSIICFADSPMAREAHEAIILEEAKEKSITTTRSLTSMVLSGHYLAALVAENRVLLGQYRTLPGIAINLMEEFEETGKRISKCTEITKYAFLGTGSYYGLAREAQLKIKEMVLLPSDSYVSLDYQHGPMSNVDSNMLVCILVSDTGRKYDLSLLKKMKELGGIVLILCDSGKDGYFDTADYLVELHTGLGDGVRDILYMPVLQFMAYYKSLSTGNDPDNPNNLYYFVEVEDVVQDGD